MHFWSYTLKRGQQSVTACCGLFEIEGEVVICYRDDRVVGRVL
jgi:hypothetical protein